MGFTDGDGCFNVYINKINKKINFTFKLSQKNNNIQVLHYMKKSLGVGVVREDKRGMAHFLIRDKVILKNIIIPLFDKNFLLTSKEYNYQQFKRCIEISDSTTLTQEQKINRINWFLNNEPEMAEYVAGTKLDECKKPKKNKKKPIKK